MLSLSIKDTSPSDVQHVDIIPYDINKIKPIGVIYQSFTMPHTIRMKEDPRHIRKERLIELIDTLFAGNQSRFARAVNKSNALIWQYAKGKKDLGEKICRDIEESCNLQHGWLDRRDETGESPDTPVSDGGVARFHDSINAAQRIFMMGEEQRVFVMNAIEYASSKNHTTQEALFEIVAKFSHLSEEQRKLISDAADLIISGKIKKEHIELHKVSHEELLASFRRNERTIKPWLEDSEPMDAIDVA